MMECDLSLSLLYDILPQPLYCGGSLEIPRGWVFFSGKAHLKVIVSLLHAAVAWVTLGLMISVLDS